MGELLRTFTYPRNAFGSSAEKSASGAMDVISRARAKKLYGYENGQIKDEAFNDSRLFLATVAGPPTEPYVTAVGERFEHLHESSPSGAWRWLLTRSMWLYSVPNGSQARVNNAANDSRARFNFFDRTLRLLVHLSALPAPHNILYFDELMPVLDDDANWTIEIPALFSLLLDSRKTMGITNPAEHAELLADLEPQYQVGRDYLNTVFRKAFGQCGLFLITGDRPKVQGVVLDPSAYENPVLAERLRFMLDHPRLFDPGASDVLA